MKALYSSFVFAACLVASASPVIVHGQVAESASSLTTGAVLKQLIADITSMINKARDDGDYLLVRAGVEAKSAMDVWQQANSGLLDKAFGELDKASRENFARARSLVTMGNAGVRDRLETVQQITENANQILESIPTGGRSTYVLRFLPRILPPNMQDNFSLRIRGVNLDVGDPNLLLSRGVAKRDLSGPLEAQFEIPLDELKRDPQKIQLHSLKIAYSTASESWWKRIWGARVNVTRELPIVTLPEHMASFELKVTRKFEKRVEREFARELGQFKAKNSRQYKVAVPEDGWRWDLSKPFVTLQGPGEAGRCEGVDMAQSSERGVSFYAHLDAIRDIFRSGDGYVNCSVRGTVYRMEQVVEDMPLQQGVFTWVADKKIDLPSDADAVTLRVKMFDGRERVITGTGGDKFFEIRREPMALIFEPRVPDDISR